MKLVIKENINGKKPITLYSNPEHRGADIDYDYLETLPQTTLDLSKDKIEFWEADKLNSPFFLESVEYMIKAINKGFKPPPVVVMKTGIFRNKYRLIDGHHRIAAYKKLGIAKIPAVVVPNKDIKVTNDANTLSKEEIEIFKKLPNIGE